jgi:hypothetical protein
MRRTAARFDPKHTQHTRQIACRGTSQVDLQSGQSVIGGQYVEQVIPFVLFFNGVEKA